jgi:uncharacterized protein
VIAVDTNVLVYAHREEFPQHRKARARVVALAEGSAPWAIPVFCIAEFLRVVTHPRILTLPFSAADACEALERVLGSPSVRVLLPGDRFWSFLTHAISEADATGNLVFDAQIVALCREGGVTTLVTEDRDFGRFPGFSTRRL